MCIAVTAACAALRIGTEHEKLAMKVGTMERAGYAEISQLLNGLVTRFGWKPMMEAGERDASNTAMHWSCHSTRLARMMSNVHTQKEVFTR
jgi:hypothetical protein